MGKAISEGRRWTFAGVAVLGLGLAGASCGVRYPVPTFRARTARFGHLDGTLADRAPIDRSVACAHWIATFTAHDETAIEHVSFPESDPDASCFVRVLHRTDDVAEPLSPPPRGCAYPDDVSDTRGKLARLADALEAVARTPSTPTPLLDCGLPLAQKQSAALHDARVLRALATDSHTYPYAAVVVPGHGLPEQGASPLMAYAPDGECLTLTAEHHRALGGMMLRTRRAAALLRGGVAPVAIVSGNSVHSTLNESFAMLHLLSCARADVSREFPPIPSDRVLLEPCADHTHTNLRNAGRWLDAIGGRAGYVITDDFIQSKYFQDENGFELLLGTIDQRSLRDFGYLIGSWRQASVGNDAGFWFTPYRFWAEPREGWGSFTCVDVPSKSAH